MNARGVMLTLILCCAAGRIEADAETSRPPPTAHPTRASDDSPLASPPDLKLEDVERTLGPFRLGEGTYTIIVHDKRLPEAERKNVVDSEALAALEIRDPSGTVLHHEKFAYSVHQRAFDEWCSASARLLEGSMNAAILIGVGCLPSAPESGDVWEIFGVWDGKFMRLGKPFTTQGEIIGFIPGPVTKNGTVTSFQPDVLQLRVWTRNFHVVVTLTANWMQGQLVPPRCFEQSGQGMREGRCEVQVDVERAPAQQELTFIRLFDEANEQFGTPKHVVVKKDSKVEFLAARVRVVASPGDVTEIGIGDDPWLKVRVDGLEGWIHTEEDFSAIGVPEAG
jgi:hypothetical protein